MEAADTVLGRMAIHPITLTGPYAGAIGPVTRLLSIHQGPLGGEERKAALEEMHLDIVDVSVRKVSFKNTRELVERLSTTDRTNLTAFERKIRRKL